MFSSSSVEAFFPTLVWVHDVEPERAAPLNVHLLERLESLTAPRPELGPGLGWQTDQTLHLLDDFVDLNRLIGAASMRVLKFLAVETEGVEITGCWANLSPPGVGHVGHHHPNNYLSGVYYVQAPPGADTITFADPRFQSEQIVPRFSEVNAHNSTAHHMTIVPGRMIIFPAWMVHTVPANTSDEMRVSIAFNIMLSEFTTEVSPPRWEGLPLKT